MRTRFWSSLALAAALLGCGIPVHAATGLGARAPVVAPPENWEARERLRDVIFATIHDSAARAAATLAQGTGAATVSFRHDVQDGALFLIFSNPVGSGYPLDGPGTYIIKRSLADGSFVQAKIFTQHDPGCYVRLFPDGERTRMDVVLFGQPFQTGVAVPARFDRLLTASFATLMDLSARSVDWDFILPPAHGPGDERLAGMVRKLRARLPGLRDMDDGAMDAGGRMVAIATGAPAAGKGGFNCSGFAKWVVDGLYAPLAGSCTDIAFLKSRSSGAAHPWSARYEEELDPWFGLDWSRGLARSLARAQTGETPPDAEIDVRDDSRVPYVKDVGYPLSALRFVLYAQAREEPGILYLGSVNAPSRQGSSEGTPTLRQHHHLVALFPYFDARGDFQVAVMERNKETSLESLGRRYAGEYAHLVRLATDGAFEPPPVE
jgi:hypothetical protein